MTNLTSYLREKGLNQRQIKRVFNKMYQSSILSKEVACVKFYCENGRTRVQVFTHLEAIDFQLGSEVK